MPPDATQKRRAAPWALGVLLLIVMVYLVLATTSARQKSVTVDELGHLPAGVFFLATGDPRYASLNPPLVNALSALPVLFLDLKTPLSPPPASDEVLSFWSTGYAFHERHRADYVRIFDAARLVPIFTLAVLAVLVFFWTRRIAPEAPDTAGLLAAALLCGSPNVIAHARIVGTDIGTALFVAASLLGLRGMLLRPGVATVALCGVLLGLAQLTKFYALLLYPVFVAVAFGWRALSPNPQPASSRLLGCLAAAFAISVVVLDTGYLWSEVGASLSDLSVQSESLRDWQTSVLGAVPIPLPGAFVRAIDGQLVEVSSTLPSFVLGERFEGGRWYYYLAILAVKTPIGLLCAFGLGLLASVPRSRVPARERLLLLAYPVLLLGVLSFSGGRQLGARALLSAVPLVWIWVAASVVRSERRASIPLLAGAVAATFVASIWTYPHYLSFFNPIAGGWTEGYRHASGSNVDIGQDLVGLADYLEGESDPADGPVQLLYYGSVDPALYGIDYVIPEASLAPGPLAISVSLYRTGYPMYDAGGLRIVGPVEPVGLGDPVARIGGSIHVYRVSPPDP